MQDKTIHRCLLSGFELSRLAIELASYDGEGKWPDDYLEDALVLWERAEEKLREAEIAYHESESDAEKLMDPVAIEVAPARPSGTISVTLEYAGRGTPMPVENPWE